MFNEMCSLFSFFPKKTLSDQDTWTNQNPFMWQAHRTTLVADSTIPNASRIQESAQ